MSGYRHHLSRANVARAQALAVALSQALEQAGASMYHIGMLSAQAYQGAREHGMNEDQACDLAHGVMAHLMHTALPLEDDGPDDGDPLLGVTR